MQVLEKGRQNGLESSYEGSLCSSGITSLQKCSLMQLCTAGLLWYTCPVCPRRLSRVAPLRDS
eukprot:2773088-Amphidinium_carterae.1